jgi:hypothetical protein
VGRPGECTRELAGRVRAVGEPAEKLPNHPESAYPSFNLGYRLCRGRDTSAQPIETPRHSLQPAPCPVETPRHSLQPARSRRHCPVEMPRTHPISHSPQPAPRPTKEPLHQTRRPRHTASPLRASRRETENRRPPFPAEPSGAVDRTDGGEADAGAHATVRHGRSHSRCTSRPGQGTRGE